MHLLVILLQQLLGFLPNKQQARPEPVRVRAKSSSSPGQGSSLPQNESRTEGPGGPQAFVSIGAAPPSGAARAASSRRTPAGARASVESFLNGRTTPGAARAETSACGGDARRRPSFPASTSSGSFDPRSPETRP